MHAANYNLQFKTVCNKMTNAFEKKAIIIRSSVRNTSKMVLSTM